MLDRKGFDFYSPTKIIFETSPHKITEELKNFGNRFVILNLRKENQNPAGLKGLRDSLNARTSGCIVHDEIIGLPDSEQIDSATFFTKRSHADCIIAYGGIETMNAAKAISILATNSFFAQDLFEQVEHNIQEPLPVVTVPIQPCLGEEITGYFSIVDAHNNTRRIFSSDKTYPKVCFIDPTLCNYLKSDDAAQIGGALMATAIESILRSDSSIVTDTILFKVIDTLTREIQSYYKDPGHERLIRLMYWISIMIGISLMNMPNSLNWSLAQTLGTRTKLSFHQALSLMLPYSMEYGLTSTAGKLVQIARCMGEKTEDISVAEAAITAIEAIRKLFMAVNLPTNLSEFYINRDHISEIARDVSKFSHMEGYYKKLGVQEIESILMTAL